MYDPTIGRFLSEDPSGFDGGDPNLYRYVGNDPVNHTDPNGLFQAGKVRAKLSNSRYRPISPFNLLGKGSLSCSPFKKPGSTAIASSSALES
jgi:uncharacterized protein RhaS with RHS repeats